MSIQLTPAEIAHYRSAVSDIAEAMTALDMIEDCDGDIEDAAISLAIHAGQQPTTSDRWLEGFAKRWRALLCRPAMQTILLEENLAEAFNLLTLETDIPSTLGMPLIIYVLKVGVEDFCHVLKEKIA
ncbi:MAG: hypothetical protein NZ772_07815 [Cyanobacteria bacterium]|nr:hypothetical protein [Cyanobacteriota bacterium]MDW8201878.1 hypothetical protein [Cyanobacteriota bacterium SKYGB_h_bin112]